MIAPPDPRRILEVGDRLLAKEAWETLQELIQRVSQNLHKHPSALECVKRHGNAAIVPRVRGAWAPTQSTRVRHPEQPDRWTLTIHVPTRLRACLSA